MEQIVREKLIELYNKLEEEGKNLLNTKTTLEDLEMTLKEKSENSIKDVENLKRELKRDGLYSEKLEEFLDNYMRYYND